MKIETFQIILESALDGITQYRPHENTKELCEARKEVNRLLDILDQQKADGATRVGFQFEKRKHSRKA